MAGWSSSAGGKAGFHSVPFSPCPSAADGDSARPRTGPWWGAKVQLCEEDAASEQLPLQSQRGAASRRGPGRPEPRPRLRPLARQLPPLPQGSSPGRPRPHSGAARAPAGRSSPDTRPRRTPPSAQPCRSAPLLGAAAAPGGPRWLPGRGCHEPGPPREEGGEGARARARRLRGAARRAERSEAAVPQPPPAPRRCPAAAALLRAAARAPNASRPERSERGASLRRKRSSRPRSEPGARRGLARPGPRSLPRAARGNRAAPPPSWARRERR